jgi:hypothetical protein
MVEFTRLATALDGNPALQRRARLAALSLTVKSGEQATGVQIGERVSVRAGAASGAAFSLTAEPLGGAREPCPRSASRAGRHAAAWPPEGRWRCSGLGRNLTSRTALRRADGGGARTVAPFGAPSIEPIVGRHLRSTSTAARIASISRSGARHPCSACTQPAPTEGNTGRS